ncbi:SDR family NAD(P)-dependent oxidoreductase [Nocardiopsis deserti]|uniref:hypothetical protein n=1 Tax=Nocardiopsis deserti TaxID=2605988 RepID=UPI0012385955|nr:hypothetical protein [Nocardiopsis deserti]
MLGHGLADLLERGDSPAIVNIAGPGGFPGKIRWEDVQLREGYTGVRAAMQSSRCNDLLGVDFPVRHPGARVRYVLYNPGFVRTGMADPLPLPQRVLTRALARVFATPAGRAAVPLARFLDAPPEAAVTAFRRGTELGLTGADFAPGAADRLHSHTVDLLSAVPGRRGS